jgi:uncharacterized damage-inducible protein DinB
MQKVHPAVARAVVCCLFCAATTMAFGQAAAPTAPAKPAVGTLMTPAETYGKLLSAMEQEFVSAAEAMPENKYDFAPTQGEFKGVRTFGEQVKHVAEANTYFFHDPTKPLIDNRADFEKLKTKAEIVAALKESFKLAHTYVDGITAQNAFVMTANGTRGGMAALGISHLMDHYGQMVVYLRMNGIVPPASRGAM